jgi:hypothetical protein
MIPSRLAGGLAVVVSCRGSRSLLFEQRRDAMNAGKMQMQHGESEVCERQTLVSCANWRVDYSSFGSDRAQHELSPAQHSTDGHGTMNPRPERRAETLAGRAWSLGTRVNRVHSWSPGDLDQSTR